MPSLKWDSVPRDTVAFKPTNASPTLRDMTLLVKIPRSHGGERTIVGFSTSGPSKRRRERSPPNPLEVPWCYIAKLENPPTPQKTHVPARNPKKNPHIRLTPRGPRPGLGARRRVHGENLPHSPVPILHHHLLPLPLLLFLLPGLFLLHHYCQRLRKFASVPHAPPHLHTQQIA